MISNKKIGIIGTGNMGEAIVGGIIASKVSSPKNIICSDVRADRLNLVKSQYGVATTKNNLKVVRESEILIYAVKPQNMAATLKETSAAMNMSKLIISIAAGVPLAVIESCVKKQLRLIRVMPNIATFVKEGAAAIAGGKHAKREDLKMAKTIFDSVGKSIIIEEELMDAVTGLSGSGPAYIFLIVTALADAGVKMGLSRQEALFLSAQTILGSAKLLLETNEHPGRLRDRVTSPGGTAIAGIHTLEEGGLRTTLMNAVEVATLRSKQLGEMMVKNFSRQ
ncbi:MAG: pyrroline-5-carboxylate reductase [Deltaproteobacteria bacterium]|nr:pyrroline-5-carboxylate reductase [Deltaproteobacteria bacterium]MBW1994033.1 pyrroline-5-carboxylate reductase [Deltaproteobacteria bacterium]MBW2152119.1 pyrroline-5-carboxylate reductase [Deltaproteobacteria bacterium]